MLEEVNNHLTDKIFEELKKDIESKSLYEAKLKIKLLHDDLSTMLTSTFSNELSNSVLNELSKHTENRTTEYFNFLIKVLDKSIDKRDLDISVLIIKNLKELYLSFSVI